MEPDLLSKIKALLDARSNESVLEVLSSHISDFPEDSEAYFWRSVVKDRLQNRMDAMNDLYKALECDPNNQQARASLELHHRIMNYYSKDQLNP